jgi:hypothetical protein
MIIILKIIALLIGAELYIDFYERKVLHPFLDYLLKVPHNLENYSRDDLESGMWTFSHIFFVILVYFVNQIIS